MLSDPWTSRSWQLSHAFPAARWAGIASLGTGQQIGSYHTRQSPLPVAIVLVGVVVAIWGLFVAPRASQRLDDPARLAVGVTMVVPKLVATRILEPQSVFEIPGLVSQIW